MGASWFLAGVPLANNYHLYVIVSSDSESIIPLGIIVLADERGISMTQRLGAWLRHDWG